MPHHTGVQSRLKGVDCSPAPATVILLLWVVCSLWLPAAAQASGAGTQGGPPAAAGCVANSYSSLQELVGSGGAGCSTSPHVTISLDCSSQKSLARKALPPLQAQAAPGSSWSISSDCFHTLMINMTENPALPVLRVRGTPGSGSKLILSKLRFLIVGGGSDSRPFCSPDFGPCSGDAVQLIIDIAGIDEVELKDLIVSPLDEVQLPFIGIRISGASSVKLDGIFTRSCVDGIQVLLSGDLDSNNVRAIGHSNTGLAYTCAPDVRPVSGVRVRGSRSGFTQNKQSGMHIACSSIYSGGPLQMTVQNTVLFGSNSGPGMTLFGEVQALFWPGVTFSSNGAPPGKPGEASPIPCGGGLYAKLLGTRSTMVFTGVKFYNNIAAAGGGVCVWLDNPNAAKDTSVSKAAASVTVQSNTVFNGNAAKDGCGGALTTIADMSKAQLDVSVKDSTKAWNRNTAAAAPTWCVLQSPETTSYMAIDLA